MIQLKYSFRKQSRHLWQVAWCVITSRNLEHLPYPYSTNCHNYIASGLKSQEDCFLNCTKSMDIATSGPLAFVPVMKREHYNLSREFYGHNPQSCEDKCSKVVCVSEQYTAVVAYSGSTYLPSVAEVRLNFPETADLNVTYKPLTTFWDFVTLFSSIFSV